MSARMEIGMPLATQEEIDNWRPHPVAFTQSVLYHFTCCRKQVTAVRNGSLIPTLIDFCNWDIAGGKAIFKLPTLNRFITSPCDDCYEFEITKELQELKVRVHAWMDECDLGGRWGTNHLDPNKHANKRIEIVAPPDASNTGTDSKDVTATPQGV